MMLARREESWLLVAALTILLNGLLVVTLARGGQSWQPLAIAGGLAVAIFIVQALVRRKHYQPDPTLLPLAVALAGIGVTFIYRLKPELLLHQMMWLSVGLVVFIVVVRFFRRLDYVANYKYIFGCIGVSLLLIAILFGADINGHRSWVILGPVRFQPSEFAKLFIVVFLAAYLSERREVLALAVKHYGPLAVPQARFIAPLLAVWGLAMVMFVLQRDMGSALLFFGIAVIMAYMASGRWTYLLVGAALFLLGSVVCYFFYSHIQTRVDIWLNPWADPNGRAYQIVQSLFALGSGGIMGSGITYGVPQLIPEVHTDFIFAAIGEELGFVGGGAVLLTYLLLITRAFAIALRAVSPFAVLVASGLAVSLALQVFLIVGGVSKFFPLTGITLPFISYGGSSMVANFMLLGMLYAIAEVRTNDAK